MKIQIFLNTSRTKLVLWVSDTLTLGDLLQKIVSYPDEFEYFTAATVKRQENRINVQENWTRTLGYYLKTSPLLNWIFIFHTAR